MRDKTSSDADFRSTPLAKNKSTYKSNKPAMTNCIYRIVQYSTNIHFKYFDICNRPTGYVNITIPNALNIHIVSMVTSIHCT